MNWFVKRRNWYKCCFKLAAYDYTESLETNLRQLMDLIYPYGATIDGAKGVYNKLLIAFNRLQRSRNAEPSVLEESKRNAMSVVSYTLNFAKTYNILQDPTMQSSINTMMAGPKWNRFISDKGGVAKRIDLVDNPTGLPGPDKWIKLIGLGVADSTISQKMQQQMGDWILIENDGINANLYVRGTQEAWNAFLAFTPWMFSNDQDIKRYRFAKPLPSEKEINPDYMAQKEQVDQQKPLSVIPLNIEESVQTKEYGKSNPAKPGIRLAFSTNDPSYIKDFPIIRDVILSDSKSRDVRLQLNPAKVSVDYDSGVIDIFDIRPSSGSAIGHARKLYSLANKLQHMEYMNTNKIREIVDSLTGVDYKTALERSRKEELGKVRSTTRINTLIQSNVGNGADIASKFGVGDTLDENQYIDTISKHYQGSQYFNPKAPFGPNNWVGPFGPSTTERQRQKQAEGMYFLASRSVSILADEPGSGKTGVAIVAADSTREENQKILVFSPNILLRENWTGNAAKGPMFFCGHDRSQVVDVATSDDLNRAVADNNVIWIIIKESTLKRRGQDSQNLVLAISSAAKQGVFSSVIIDEIQRIKDPNSIIFKKLQAAVSWYDIPHRIALTGTPSDNTPSDMWVELMLLRHPVLSIDKGIRHLAIGQNIAGFTEQYLGGESLSQSVIFSSEERKEMTQDEQDDERERRWVQKAGEVLKWASSLDNKRKETILDLFSTTFLRRNKEDIKPEIQEIAPLSRGVIPVDKPESLELSKTGVNWHTKALVAAAEAKVPYTVNEAVSFLGSDPSLSKDNNVFIVSQYKHTTKAIADGINEAMGPGTAYAITGDVSDSERAEVSRSFRDQTTNLKAVVYTLKLGAVGLNFENASYAIFNDMDWNPSINLQTEYRVHRINSEHPVHINYMVMDGTYDQEMYQRVMKKKEINNTITGLMRQANQATGKDKINIANEFIKDTIENILLDAGLTPGHQQWFDEQLDKALRGEEIGEYQEPRQEDPLDAIMPDYIKEDEEWAQRHWRNTKKQELAEAFGDQWVGLDIDTIKEFFERKELGRIGRLKDKGLPAVAKGIMNWYKTAI